MEIKYQKQWEFLKGKFETGQLAHAYLLSGTKETEKEVFAKEFVKFINCLYSNSHGRENCSVDEKKEICQNCKMINSGSFPDLLTVTSGNSESSLKNEKDMMEIGVGQIRSAQKFLSYKSYYGAYKTVIVEDAERMTLEAQNCFLKSLEEPKGKTIIFLLTSKPDLLLPTIFSRCQQIKLFSTEKYEISPEEKIVMQDLLKIINSDLAEKFKYAKSVNLEEGNFNKVLNILQRYFRQLLLIKIGVISKNQVVEIKDFTIGQIKKVLELIENLIYQADKTNTNKKLALEILLMEI